MKIKKILMGVFALTLSVVGLVAGTHTVNAESTTLKMTDSGWWWQRIQPDDGNYHSWHLTWYEFNGRIAYCIQPGIPEGDTYQTGNLDSYNISNEQKERIMLIAYYGYDYTGHQTTEYRAATQALLWETINADQTVFSSKRWAQGTIYDISAQRNEIERLVRNHYVRPSFNGTTINAKVGEEVILTDTNNVLSNYYVSASNGAEVRIDGNKLIVKTTKVGKVTLQFKKRLYTDREYLVYYSSGKQTMMSSGIVDPALSVVNIESLGGKVEFTKYDRDNNSTIPSGEATLEGAVYGIYNAETDALVSKVTTGKDGKGKLEHLPAFAKYYLKEILPSKGYELDTNKYYFESTLENIDNEIAVNEKVINRDVEITKVYAINKSEIMTPEPNVEFGFYNNKGELFTKGVTDKNGKLTVNLVYGSYTVKQLTTSKDTTKVDDFNLDVRKSGSKIYYTISNAKITAKLKVVKIDKDTKEVIKRSNICFRIFNTDKNEYVSQSVTYPKKETLDKFCTNNDVELITPNPLESGNYKLEEIDQVIDKYLWNKESQKFTIGEDSKLINDNEYGILFEVKFENKEVKGTIKVNKKGENVELKENGYEYKEVELEGVKFGLYANENITDGTGNVIYKKGDLVKEVLTDKDGNIKIDNLHLGKYYLQEIATVGNHVLDKTKYEFELKYKDQYTDTIEYTTSIKNHLASGKLEFTKIDFSTSKPLPDTKIEIYTENDKLVFTGVTDENGKIIIDRLPVGKYYILEKEAKEGWEINPDKMFFEIKEDGEIVKSVMKDNQIVEVPNTYIRENNKNILFTFFFGVAGAGIIIYGIRKNYNDSKTKRN